MARGTQFSRAIVCDMPTHFFANAHVLLALFLALTCHALTTPIVNQSMSVSTGNISSLDVIIPHCRLSLVALLLSALSYQEAQGIFD